MKLYSGKKVLVTGGLGFIGSNLTRALVKAGANVTVIDSMLPDYGGNEFNLKDVRNDIHVSYTDMRDPHAMPHLVADKEIIFNLAGQISHMDSMQFPIDDLEINAKAQLNLLEVCRKFNREVILVHASTRQVYGKTDGSPTSEDHPVKPTDVNGINKLAGEMFHLVYNNVHGIRTVCLRLTNTYGPRQLIKHNKQGFIAWFLNRALQGETIQLFGDGQQLRDLMYVTDVVDAMLKVAFNEKCYGEIFNLGGLRSYTLKETAELLQSFNPKTKVEYIPFPSDRQKIDIGSYKGDFTKLNQLTEWKPTTSLEAGLKETFTYYQENLSNYLSLS